MRDARFEAVTPAARAAPERVAFQNKTRSLRANGTRQNLREFFRPGFSHKARASSIQRSGGGVPVQRLSDKAPWRASMPNPLQ